MKYLAAVVIALSAVPGVMQAQGCDETTKDERLPQGLVTVEEHVPTIQVEAKRWSGADEMVRQSAIVIPRINEWVAQLVRSDLARKLLP